jgi:hypothetical protein
LEERQNRGIGFTYLSQEIRVADLGQTRLFIFFRKAGKVVSLLVVQARDLLLLSRAQRALLQKLGPRCRTHSRHQAIFAEGLFIKEAGGIEVAVQLLIVGLIKGLRLDAQIFEDVFGDLAVVRRALDRLRATITQQQPPSNAKLVATSVPAEIVVVIKDQK